MRCGHLAIVLLSLILAGCATWQQPAPVDTADFRQRASVEQAEGVTVRALVLNHSDGERLFGADLFALDIEPIWLEVRNDSDQPVWLLQSGADPDYFSPLEVSWSLHSTFGGSNNAAIDSHIEALAFPRGPLLPGQVRQGVIFTNPHYDTKLLNIDIYGDRKFIPLTFFLPIPDQDGNVPAPEPWPYDDAQMSDFSSQQSLKRALEDWFSNAGADAFQGLSEPLSLVWVGRPRNIGAALTRRGYRWGVREYDQQQRLLGRTPDFVVRKAGQGGVPANWIRLWALPVTFQQRPVLVAQVGAPKGGRFASDDGEVRVDPALDDVRDMVVQDMLYSRGLAKLAVMRPGRDAAQAGHVTDGKVGVLFVTARPRGLADVIISDWQSVDWSLGPEPYGPRAPGTPAAQPLDDPTPDQDQ